MSEGTLRPEEVAELDPYKRRRKTVVSEAEELLQGPEGEAVIQDDEVEEAEPLSPIQQPAIQINPIPYLPKMPKIPTDFSKEINKISDSFDTGFVREFQEKNNIFTNSRIEKMEKKINEY